MNTNQALKAVWNCYNFKGHSFGITEKDYVHSGPLHTRHAKKITRRANRRLNKTLCQDFS